MIGHLGFPFPSFLPFSPSLCPSLFFLVPFLVRWEDSNDLQTTEVRTPRLPLTNHLISEILLNLSEPQIPCLLSEVTTVPTSYSY